MNTSANELLEKAETALEKRSALTEERTRLADDTRLTSAQKESRAKELDKEIRELGIEARSHVEAAEIRAIHERAAKLTAAGHAGRDHNGNVRGAMEWRSLIPTSGEYRALVAEGTPSTGGYATPTGVAQQYIDRLRNQAQFLKAPGLNVVPFDTASFVVPQLTASSAPGVVAEGVSITEGSLTFAGQTFTPIKYAARYTASSEIVADASVDINNLIADTMIRDVAVQVDFDAFRGNGTASLKGIMDAANGTTTTFAAGAGHTTVKWDDVIDGVATIMGTGAQPTVVWASVDSWKALVKERAIANGDYLAGPVTDNPADVAWGLKLLPTAQLPVRTVIVADASRVFFGVRSEVRLSRSEDFAFDRDAIGYRLTYRVAGIKSAETSSVQVLVAPAT